MGGASGAGATGRLRRVVSCRRGLRTTQLYPPVSGSSHSWRQGHVQRCMPCAVYAAASPPSRSRTESASPPAAAQSCGSSCKGWDAPHMTQSAMHSSAQSQRRAACPERDVDRKAPEPQHTNTRGRVQCAEAAPPHSRAPGCMVAVQLHTRLPRLTKRAAQRVRAGRPLQVGGRREASAAVSGASAAAPTSTLYTLAAGCVVSCCNVCGTLLSLAARLVLAPPPLLQGQAFCVLQLHPNPRATLPAQKQSAALTVSSGGGTASSAFCLASTAACSSSQEGALSANWMPRCGGAAVAAAPPCGRLGAAARCAARQHKNLCKAGQVAASAEMAWMAPRRGHGDHSKCPT